MNTNKIIKVDVSELRQPKVFDLTILKLLKEKAELLADTEERFISGTTLIMRDNDWHLNYINPKNIISKIYTIGGIILDRNDNKNVLLKPHKRYGVLNGVDNIRFISEDGDVILKSSYEQPNILRHLDEKIATGIYQDIIEKEYKKIIKILLQI